VDGNSPRSAKGHITQDAERPRRRGRPSLAQVDGNAVAEGEGLGEKKIGRPKNGTKAAENVEEAIEGNGVAPAKKGARKGLPQQVEPPTTQRGHGKGSRGVRNELGAAAALQHEREGRKGRRGAVKEVRVPASSAPEPVKRKRGRPSKTVEELRSKEAAADGGDHPIGTKKLPKPMRGRPSKNELRSEKEQGSESSQHPRTSNPASQYEMQVQDRLSKQRAILEQHRKPTRLASQQHDRTKKRKDHESEDQVRAKRQRFEEPSKDVANASEKETKPSYQHLATVTHSVSMQTIEKKWAALPPACIERISQLCQSLLRPVVMHVTDERRKIEASTAVEMVSRRLTNKLSKGIPFPQATRTRREDDFDFENILDHNRLLAAQLMPILHSNELLESELIKQKVLIEQDKEVLTQLETNAKSEAARVKQDERKQHVLVQCQDFSHENDNIGRDIGLNAIYNVTRSVFDVSAAMHYLA